MKGEPPVMKHWMRTPLAAALTATLAANATADPPGMNEKATLFAMHAARMGNLRSLGMTNPENLAGQFEDAPKLEWEAKIAPEFIGHQIADFFAGTQVFTGPQDATGGVFGLYNPWWDAILMLQTKGALPEKMDDKVVVPRVSNFLLLSGETFRGENPAKPAFDTVVPGEKDPLSPAIWRAHAATLKRFNELFGNTETVSFRPLRALGEPDAKKEMERVQVRSGLRLKFESMLLKNTENLAIAKRVGMVLREGPALFLNKHFASPDHQFFVDTFAKLPRELRSGFDCYGCLPAKDGSLFLFVNKDAPRLFATVSFPAGRIQDPAKGHVIFEWYDLAQADELLKAWNEEKKGGKQ